jgi:hypothetical protein
MVEQLEGAAILRRLEDPFRHTNETFNVVARDANATHSKNLDGNKKDAAEALFLLREPAKKYFGCIVCGRTVFTKRPVKYRLDKKITQGDAAGRELVRVGRKHCDEFHRNTWVWNLVPDSGWLTCEERRDGHERAHLDGILHQAMSNAARKMPVPTDKHLDLTILFCQRVTFAQCWLAWCSKSYLRQSKSVVVSNGVRDVAYQRLSEIQNSAIIHMRSYHFQQKAHEYGKDQLINLLQLYFMQIGRYKQCGVFVEISLFERMKQMPDIE